MSKVADGGNALCFLFRRLNFLCFRVLVSFQCVVSVKRVTSQSVCKVFFCSLRIANCYGKFGHHVWRCNLTKVNDRVFSSFLEKKKLDILPITDILPAHRREANQPTPSYPM